MSEQVKSKALGNAFGNAAGVAAGILAGAVVTGGMTGSPAVAAAATVFGSFGAFYTAYTYERRIEAAAVKARENSRPSEGPGW